MNCFIRHFRGVFRERFHDTTLSFLLLLQCFSRFGGCGFRLVPQAVCPRPQEAEELHTTPGETVSHYIIISPYSPYISIHYYIIISPYSLIHHYIIISQYISIHRCIFPTHTSIHHYIIISPYSQYIVFTITSSRPSSSVFIYPAIVTILFTSLTFPLGLGKFMAGELTQHAAINHLFSNVTWSTLPPPHEAFQDLPEDSDEYQIVRQWGQPNIFVTLLLFSALRVSQYMHVIMKLFGELYIHLNSEVYQ